MTRTRSWPNENRPQRFVSIVIGSPIGVARSAAMCHAHGSSGGAVSAVVGHSMATSIVYPAGR